MLHNAAPPNDPNIRARRRRHYVGATWLTKNATATEKTAKGIRKFAADIAKLKKFIAGKIR